MAQTRPDIPCSFDPCERPSFCKGLCRRHYEQQNEGKPLTPIRAKRAAQPDRCEVEGCTRSPRSRGMCGMHLHRVKVHGTPGGADSWHRAGCIVEDCSRPHQAGGYCATHLRRLQVHGKLELDTAPRICKIEDCGQIALSSKSAKGNGYCVRHHLDRWVTDYLAGKVQGRRYPNGYEFISVRKVNYMVHRLVMERTLGRELMDGETPHHRNGIRHDNRPENLELWVSPQPKGQRPEDLVEWVVEHYPDLVLERLALI